MKIKFSKNFSKQYHKTPKKVRDQFKNRLKIFKQNKFDPVLNNHKLTGHYMGYRSINITGDYRAVFEEQGDLIYFTALGTHSQLYK
jgi:addiction module RelE/StbE family toxin